MWRQSLWRDKKYKCLYVIYALWPPEVSHCAEIMLMTSLGVRLYYVRRELLQQGPQYSCEWVSEWVTQIKNINVGIMYMYYTEWTEYSLPFLSKYCLFSSPWSLPVEPWWAPRMSWQQQWSVLTSQLLLSFTFCPSVSWPDCLHWRPVPAVPQSPGRPQ